MGEPVELCDIVGGTANDDSENAYEIPQASTDEGRYENLRINTGDGLAAGSNIVSDTDTNHKVEDSNGSESRSTCVKHISAVRQLQMLCAVLFTIVIICSVTIGVLINKLDSRMSAVESDRHNMLSAIAANEQRITSEVDGQWTDWLQWSGCSATCESGQMTRQRLCLKPMSLNGGKSCVGANSEQRSCQLSVCPVNGGWSSWSTWSSCTKTCNTGQKERHRTCSNPAPDGIGRGCIGLSDEQSTCNESPCPRLQIGFSASGSTILSGSVVQFDSIKTNYGSRYSPSTGRFTCSHPGLYYFSTSLIKLRTNVREVDRIMCYIYKNTGSLITTVTDPTDDDTDKGSYETSAFLTVHLSRGDQVYVMCTSGKLNSYSSFSGILIQSD